jgi:hypothetical protein
MGHSSGPSFDSTGIRGPGRKHTFLDPSSSKLFFNCRFDTCIPLAQVWKDGPLDDSEQQVLKGRTRSVLRGDDPVIQLLDNHIKELFLAVASSEGMSFLLNARAGIKAVPTHTKEPPFLQRARQKYQDRGLGIYSLDLAHGAQLATKVADLS